MGSSTEGHISHVLSARMSSRPMGWSRQGADSLAHIRIYWKNGGDMLELIKQQKEREKKKGRKIKNISVQAKSCHGKRSTAKQMENI